VAGAARRGLGESLGMARGGWTRAGATYDLSHSATTNAAKSPMVSLQHWFCKLCRSWGQFWAGEVE
jgi:hypothetical protein